jgi:hypothetical protein
MEINHMHEKLGKLESDVELDKKARLKGEGIVDFLKIIGITNIVALLIAALLYIVNR